MITNQAASNYNNKNGSIIGGGVQTTALSNQVQTSNAQQPHLNLNNNNNSNISNSGAAGGVNTSFNKFYGNSNTNNSELLANGHGPRREVCNKIIFYSTKNSINQIMCVCVFFFF